MAHHSDEHGGIDRIDACVDVFGAIAMDHPS